MSDQYFDYDEMIQDALKGVVVKILEDVSDNGLKGDHHYYVAFNTKCEGVKLPPSLIARYPDEMTIVIQHRYWGLNIQAEYFEIGLSFDQKPELLTIPYAALIGFVDPSAQFALQFEYGEETASNDTGLESDAEEEIAIKPDVKNIAINKKPSEEQNTSIEEEASKVVTLDAFRKKKPTK